jgi:hypothetical protein
MDAASGSKPARGEDGRSLAHGVIVSLLVEAHPDRIVVGSRTLFLRDGTVCTYLSGTNLEVHYTELDGRAEVQSITALKPTR